MTIKIALADDHPLMRAGLAMLIDDIEGFEVVAQASDGLGALEQARALQPDVMILDIQMPHLSGLDCLAQIAAQWPDIRVLVLSMYVNEDHVRRAIELGAAGYLLKGANPAELELALKTVSCGGFWLSSGISRDCLQAPQKAQTVSSARVQLSPRQQQILKRLAEGASVKEMAFELSLSIKTVETHRTQMMERLQLKDIPALVRYAIREGIIAL